MNPRPCNWYNISYPLPTDLPLLMAIQPILDTSLPVYFTQAYLITHTWTKISDF